MRLLILYVCIDADEFVIYMIFSTLYLDSLLLYLVTDVCKQLMAASTILYMMRIVYDSL